MENEVMNTGEEVIVDVVNETPSETLNEGFVNEIEQEVTE